MIKGGVMCKCDPRVKTPYCGKSGCEYPDSASLTFNENAFRKTIVNININETFKAELTPYGEEVYRNSGEIMRYNPDTKIIEGELWLFMSVFHSEMYNGAKQVFKDNIISLIR